MIVEFVRAGDGTNDSTPIIKHSAGIDTKIVLFRNINLYMWNSFYSLIESSKLNPKAIIELQYPNHSSVRKIKLIYSRVILDLD